MTSGWNERKYTINNIISRGDKKVRWNDGKGHSIHINWSMTQVQSTVTQDNPIYLFLIYTRSLRKDITVSILLHNWFRRAAVFHDKHRILGWLNLQHTQVSFHSESINIFRKEKHYSIFFVSNSVPKSSIMHFFHFFFPTLVGYSVFSARFIKEITKQRMVQMAKQSSICNSCAELTPRAAWAGKTTPAYCHRSVCSVVELISKLDNLPWVNQKQTLANQDLQIPFCCIKNPGGCKMQGFWGGG